MYPVSRATCRHDGSFYEEEDSWGRIYQVCQDCGASAATGECLGPVDGPVDRPRVAGYLRYRSWFDGGGS